MCDKARTDGEYINIPPYAFRLADAMIAEAEKRTDKERPAILSDWISVKDRLPEFDLNVLVFYTDESVSVDYLPFSEDVTHWQPLPNPPRGVK